MRKISYDSPKAVDYTTFSNYVKPEDTLEKVNTSWVDRQSAFFTFDEHWIFQGSCHRRKPEEIEFKRSTKRITALQYDALRSYVCPVMKPDAVDRRIVARMKVQYWFRYSSITTSRGMPGLAVVIDNEFIPVYS
jgi:hypothetical protein